MRIVRSPKVMQKICGGLKREGKIIGFVPTMGYLHEGHLSLIRIAKKRSDVLVVSVFVNPTQFGPKEDFKRYPRDFKRDRFLLESRLRRDDFVFAPRIKDMYPEGYLTYVNVDKIAHKLEGAIRPGHFQGVTTVVAKLFNIVQPDFAVFGQKDAQQAVVLKKMVDDLNYGIKMIIAPTVREKDGLAISSRNVYLTKEERKQARVLYQALRSAKEMINRGERKANRILSKMKALINKQPLADIDYIAITDANSLELLDELKGDILISLAVRFGKTRLIDNIKMEVVGVKV
ncbi:MAG: pantoate--beta-alanine ligase [candidate division Zixibacteria bacterium]|nr:pantoate--beta-alanine ligase [candidate division Zixibacteria bacterium]